MKRNSIIGISLVLLVTLSLLAVVVYQSGQGGSGRADETLLVRPHASTLGPADAKVHIVEFLDPACETCRAFYPFVKQLMAANPGKIKLTTRHVDFHRGSNPVVRLLEASKKQGRYWPTLERVLAAQPQWVILHEARIELLWPHLGGVGLDLDRLRGDMNADDVERHTKQDRADAAALKVDKTPEYFVNGRRMQTFGYEQLQQLVQDELAASDR